MKTIEISNAKARILAEYLAPRWADLATRLAAAGVGCNNPLRRTGETNNSRSFKARVKRRRVELAAVGDVLVALGASLPSPNKAALIGPYTSPRLGAKPTDMWRGGARAEAERSRVAAAILSSIAV